MLVPRTRALMPRMQRDFRRNTKRPGFCFLTSNIPGGGEDDQELSFHVTKGLLELQREGSVTGRSPLTYRDQWPRHHSILGAWVPLRGAVALLFQFLAVWVRTDGPPRWCHPEEFESQESHTKRVRYFMGDN